MPEPLPLLSSPPPSGLPYAPPPGTLHLAPQPFKAATPTQATALLKDAIATSNMPVPDRPVLQLPPSTAQPLPNLQSSGVTSPTGVKTGTVPTPVSNLPTVAGVPGAIRPPIPIGKIAGGAVVGGVVDLGSRLASGQPVGHAIAGASATTAGSAIGGAAGFIVGGPAGAMLGGMVGGVIAGAAFDAFNPPTTAENQPTQTPRPWSPSNSYPAPVRYRVTFRDGTTFQSSCYSYTYGVEYYPDGSGPHYVFRPYWNDGRFATYSIQPGSLEFLDPIPTNAPESPKADARSLPRFSPPSPEISIPPAPVSLAPSPGAATRPGGLRTIPSGTTPNAPTANSNLGGALPELQRSPSPTAAPALGFAPDKPKLDLVPNLLQAPLPQANNRGTTTQPIGGLAGPSPDAVTAAATPTAQGQTTKATPVPDSQKPAPKPTQTPEEKADQDLADRLGSIEAQLTMLGLAIATLVAKPLNAPGLSPEEAKQAAKSGTCETLAPDGCMRPEFDNLNNQNQRNSNTLDKIDAAMQGLDLAGVAELNKKVDRIDTKLGDQIPNGGISGKLGEIFNKFAEVLEQGKDLANKTWEALGLDRVISVITMVAAVHNATLLSRDLGETFIEAANSVTRALQATIPGFLKKPDGENLEIDIGEVLGDKLESFLKEMLGVATYNDLKAKWIKSNRILTAGSNMLSAMRGMSNALGDGLEVVGGYVAKGFNGIQKDGLVSDRSWPWMDEDLNFKNPGITRFTDKIDNTEEAVSSIQQIAESVVEFTEEASELVKNTTELKKALDADTDKIAAEEAKKDAESASPDIDDDDLLPSGGDS